jgi:hypothetical protein
MTESHVHPVHDLYQYNELKNYSDLRELQVLDICGYSRLFVSVYVDFVVGICKFVSGKIWVPLCHLRRLSIIPLRDAFLRLPPRLTSLARTSLLYLIIEKVSLSPSLSLSLSLSHICLLQFD